MMLKCVAFSPSVPGKAYSLWLRNGGRLKALSTSLGGISAAFRPPAKQVLAAAPFQCQPRGCVHNQELTSSSALQVHFHSAEGSAREAHQPQHDVGLVAGWLFPGKCTQAARSLALVRPLHRLVSCGGVPGPQVAQPPAFAEAVVRNDGVAAACAKTEESHGKKVHSEYHVTGIPGDGRCLFRAVAHGSCLRSGRPAPDETTQRQMADDLRNKALDELVKRRESSEWFIEGDFDAYVKRMRKPHTWGGEPELLMLSNVLRTPITVYMKDRGGVISIAEYGQEHGHENPIRVLYHGSGHYEALHLPEDKQMSRL